MTDAQVQSEVMEVLQTMFPNVTIPEPTAFLFPRWFSDPLYRGSYTTWPQSFSSEHLINLAAPLGNLWFAGEATSEKYFGTLFFCPELSGACCVDGGWPQDICTVPILKAKREARRL
jgi:hypothetical protein